MRKPARDRGAARSGRNENIAPIPVTPMPFAKANQALVELQQGRLVGRAVLTP